MSLYHYNNLPRLCYWWSNPNDAAVAIGMFLPFIWILAWYIEKEARATFIKNLFWIVECAALALLVNTYSRWAIFSSFCSIVVFGLIAERPERLFTQAAASVPGAWCALSRRFAGLWILLRNMKTAGLRIAVLLIALIATNALGRMSLAVQGDKSVLNRLTLWAGGLRMVAAKPISGWGNGSSGLNYDNWYQDLASQTAHGSMVNSYLNMAVEWGLPALGIVLFLLFAGLFLCFRLAGAVSPSNKGLLAGVAAVITFFSLGNFSYSTIYNTLPLALLATGALILAVFFSILRKCVTLAGPLLWPFFMSLFCVLSLYLVGLFSVGKEPVRVVCKGTGNILLCKTDGAGETVNLTIIPDYKTLGPCYGRPIRKIFSEKIVHFNALQILEPGADFQRCDGEKIIVLGSRVGEWGSRTGKNSPGIILVCPTALPLAPGQIERIFLPQIDKWHVAEAWKSWAGQNNCPVVFLDGDGILNETNLQKIFEYYTKS